MSKTFNDDDWVYDTQNNEAFIYDHKADGFAVENSTPDRFRLASKEEIEAERQK